MFGLQIRICSWAFNLHGYACVFIPQSLDTRSKTNPTPAPVDGLGEAAALALLATFPQLPPSNRPPARRNRLSSTTVSKVEALSPAEAPALALPRPASGPHFAKRERVPGSPKPSP